MNAAPARPTGSPPRRPSRPNLKGVNFQPAPGGQFSTGLDTRRRVSAHGVGSAPRRTGHAAATEWRRDPMGCAVPANQADDDIRRKDSSARTAIDRSRPRPRGPSGPPGSTDPLGVLSIYIDAGSGTSDGRIDVSNRLNQLQRQIGIEGTRAQARALDDALSRLQPAVARLFDPDAPGRGRGLFAALCSPAVTCFSSQLRLPNRVILDASPFIHPLLELLDEGRPAGCLRPLWMPLTYSIGARANSDG